MIKRLILCCTLLLCSKGATAGFFDDVVDFFLGGTLSTQTADLHSVNFELNPRCIIIFTHDCSFCRIWRVK